MEHIEMKPSAKVILDSISYEGHRLTTMEVVMHRFVLAEFNTHRVFSRNSASSRAIPYVKQRNKVAGSPAYPIHWGAEQKGMQSGDELTDEYLRLAQKVWDTARVSAIDAADILHEAGLHKSLINRLLEPFMWHTVIVTATEWDNFFWQRCHPDAQPEMKAAADEMQRAYYTSTPSEMKYGIYHTPYVGPDESDMIFKEVTLMDGADAGFDAVKRVSVARCARVSYLTHDGVRDYRKDLELFDKLKGSGHWSPFEHVATPQPPVLNRLRGPSSNFVGWNQYRKDFANENRTKFVPNLPDLMEKNND